MIQQKEEMKETITDHIIYYEGKGYVSVEKLQEAKDEMKAKQIYASGKFGGAYVILLKDIDEIFGSKFK